MDNMEIIVFDQLAEALQPFNSKDVLAKVGALHLLPENASRAISLDCLAHIVAAQPYDSSKPSISIDRLRRLLREHLSPSSLPGLQDDPSDEMFTEEIVFHGGYYIVFPGPNSDTPNILRWLLKAIFLRKHVLGSRGFRDEVGRLAFACLAISDRIARKANLSRGIVPDYGKVEDITVPFAAKLRDLSRAVQLDTAELSDFLSQSNICLDVLDPLIIDIGNTRFSQGSFSGGTLHSKPFVGCGDGIIVPEPSALLTALRHRILCLANEQGILGELAAAFQEAVWDNVLELFQYWRCRPLQTALPEPSLCGFREGLFSLDSDKALYVQLVTDSLDNFSSEVAFGQWNSEVIAGELERRQSEIARSLMEQTPHPERVLIITVVQHLGRGVVIGFRDEAPLPSLRLFLTASELEVVTKVDADDPLALWKFARGYHRIRQKTKILAFSFLDEYQLYRSQRRSYYLSNDRPPTLISIVPGTGLALRKEAFERFDPHGTQSFHQHQLIEVWRLFKRGIPLYAPPALAGQRAAVVVDSLFPMPFWIVGPEDLRGKLHSFSAHLAETIGYWVWQFEPFLRGPFSLLAGRVRRLCLYLDFHDRRLWGDALSNTSAAPKDSHPILSTICHDARIGDVTVTVSPSLLLALATADNLGERRLMREILQVIRTALESIEPRIADLLSDAEISKAIDKYAPLGPKKHLLALMVQTHPELDSAGLPNFRAVQDSEQADILDQLGEKLRNIGWKEGQIPSASRTKLLGDAVAHLFAELENLVATLHREELLPTIVAYQEAATKEYFLRYLTIPTRLACFEKHEELVKQLSKELPEVSVANTANRFLVEYIAACPPNGDRALSLEMYDQLLALSAQIIELGILSDIIHLKIADPALSVLPSGRLGHHQDALLVSQKAFLGQYMAGEIGRAASSFRSHWLERLSESQGENEEDRLPPMLRELNKAILEEFGMGLLDIRSFVEELYEVGGRHDAGVAHEPLDNLKAELAKSLAWAESKVETALDLFSLRRRDKFWEPQGHKKEEVYPWRFNRALSYMRRALVIMEGNGQEYVLWGKRHLFHSYRYLIDLCRTGRLKAFSAALKNVMTKLRDEAATAFEDEVATIISAQHGTVVKTRVKKLGNLRLLGSNGEDLGDIDVLVGMPHSRVLLVIECKDLELARTPREIQHQLVKLFKGTEGQKATTAKHLSRAQWVKDNLSQVLAALKLSPSGKWRVQPLLVCDVEMYAPHLTSPPFPMWSIDMIKSRPISQLVGELTDSSNVTLL